MLKWLEGDLKELRDERADATDERRAEIDKEIADIKARREKVRKGIDPYADEEKPSPTGGGDENANPADGAELPKGLVTTVNGKPTFDTAMAQSLTEQQYKTLQARYPELQNMKFDDFKKAVSMHAASKTAASR